MDIKGKNILMIIPNLDFGGAQRSFCSLANELDKKHNVYICVFNTIDGIAFKHTPQVIDLAIPGGQNMISKIFRFGTRYREIRALKRRLRIDTTISYLEGANYLNILTKGRDKVVVSVRGSKLFDPNITGFTGFLRRKYLIPMSYRQTDAIVALNEGIKRELIAGFGVYGGKTTVIRNFYDIDSIELLANEPLSNQFSELLETKYILYSGRFAPEKGLLNIVECFNRLRSKVQNIKLVMLGEGPMRNELIKYALSKGLKVGGVYEQSSTLAPDVVFVGYQQNPYNFIKNATILLLASKSEGGPNILLESMLCETLVLSTDCPYGPREQIAPQLSTGNIERTYEGDYGVLLPENKNEHDIDVITEWVEAIQKYLDNNTKRNSIVKRAKSYAMRFTADKILTQWEKII